MWIGAPLAIDSYFAIRKKPKPERAPPVLLRILGVVLGLYSIAVGIFFGFSAFIVLGSAVALLFAITFFVRIHLTRSPFAALGLVSFSILLAMLFGVDETRKQLNQKSNRARADLRLLDKSLKSIVLRSGERGILTYDPQSQIFSFNKWETVKGVDWSRRGLRATAEEAASELLR